MMLSINPSYYYVPWATATNSQLLQAMVTQNYVAFDWANWGGWTPGNANTWGASYSIMHLIEGDKDELNSADVAAANAAIQQNTAGHLDGR